MRDDEDERNELIASLVMMVFIVPLVALLLRAC
jgi:hypothetical protein